MSVKSFNRVPGSPPGNWRRLLPSSLIVVSVIVLAGCGGNDWKADTFPARGTIQINGAAPEGAVITFHPVGEPVDQRGSQPWAIVDTDGSYVLQTYEKGDGAPAGEYQVTIKWPWDVTDMAQAMTDRLGKAYTNPESSEWKFTITEDDNELPPIEIEGVKLQSKTQKKKNRNQPVMPDTGGV
ncbi:MAG: hypothetical protein HUJ26_16785 [Planctomycetaceae bacterium]|nr:hypothetical protein [Planctomycetaceae bacterium]